MGDPGQRRRETDAPSGRTIARKGCRGQPRPPRCGHPEGSEGQAPSRSAHCAFFPASLPARPRPQPPEPEVGSAASYEPAGEAGPGLGPPSAPRGGECAVPLLHPAGVVDREAAARAGSRGRRERAAAPLPRPPPKGARQGPRFPCKLERRPRSVVPKVPPGAPSRRTPVLAGDRQAERGQAGLAAPTLRHGEPTANYR